MLSSSIRAPPSITGLKPTAGRSVRLLSIVRLSPIGPAVATSTVSPGEAVSMHACRLELQAGLGNVSVVEKARDVHVASSTRANSADVCRPLLIGDFMIGLLISLV